MQTKFQNIFNQTLQNKEKNAIYLKTGGGKTYNSLHTLEKLVKEGKVRYPVFIVPYAAMKKNFISDYKNQGIEITENVEAWLEGVLGNRILLICPEKLSFAPEIPHIADFVVLDELHLIPTSKSYRKAYTTLEFWLNKKELPVIAMTGTPVPHKENNGYIDIHLDNEFDLGIKTDLEASITIINTNAPDLYIKMAVADETDHPTLFFANTKEYLPYVAENCDMVITSETVKYTQSDIEINGDTAVKQLLETGILPKDIKKIYATSCFTTGISITSEIPELNIYIKYDETVNILDICQIINRFRKISSQKVNIYLFNEVKKDNNNGKKKFLDKLNSKQGLDTKTGKKLKRHLDIMKKYYLSNIFKCVNIEEMDEFLTKKEIEEYEAEIDEKYDEDWVVFKKIQKSLYILENMVNISNYVAAGREKYVLAEILKRNPMITPIEAAVLAKSLTINEIEDKEVNQEVISKFYQNLKDMTPYPNKMFKKVVKFVRKHNEYCEIEIKSKILYNDIKKGISWESKDIRTEFEDFVREFFPVIYNKYIYNPSSSFFDENKEICNDFKAAVGKEIKFIPLTYTKDENGKMNINYKVKWKDESIYVDIVPNGHIPAINTKYLPRDIFVFDFDTKNMSEEQIKEVEEFINQIKDNNDIWITKTKSGGYHIFCKCPANKIPEQPILSIDGIIDVISGGAEHLVNIYEHINHTDKINYNETVFRGCIRLVKKYKEKTIKEDVKVKNDKKDNITPKKNIDYKDDEEIKKKIEEWFFDEIFIEMVDVTKEEVFRVISEKTTIGTVSNRYFTFCDPIRNENSPSMAIYFTKMGIRIKDFYNQVYVDIPL